MRICMSDKILVFLWNSILENELALSVVEGCLVVSYGCTFTLLLKISFQLSYYG